MMRVPFLDLAWQYQSIKSEIDSAIAGVITSAGFVGGPTVAEFESNYAAYVGVDYCVGVGNGTDALELILKSLDLRPGGEVVVPANSFIGSAEAVTNAGFRVRFCDVDESYTLDPAELERAIGPQTVAVMPVHLYGQPTDMGAILQIAADRGLRVVEDCAQAHGAEFRGRRVGSIGDAGAFSFYPGKNLGAYGDGGAVVTNDASLAQRVRMMANHGRIGKYEHEFEGRNSRLDGLQAAVLTVKLRHLDQWTARRREVAEVYTDALGSIAALSLQSRLPDTLSAHHLYPIRTSQRERLRSDLSSQGIATGIHYPFALPRLAAYAHLGQSDLTPRSNSWSVELLSIPIGEHLTDDQVAHVIETLSSADLA